ncbi:MAG TPA: hypothetical protein VEC38_05595, partial [Candidatus Binataceae bacterium]|nr:hypothetical protein [Candidatus Binataceae bacterium]
MSRTGNLEENLLLALEQNLAIVDPPREKHQPVDLDKLLAGEALIGLLGSLEYFAAGLGYGLGSHLPLRCSPNPVRHCKTGRGAADILIGEPKSHQADTSVI